MGWGERDVRVPSGRGADQGGDRSHGARFRDPRDAETHIFFLTSTWLSLRSYSFRIFCFSASTTCSFSMLNSCRGWAREGRARGQIASVAWREKKKGTRTHLLRGDANLVRLLLRLLLDELHHLVNLAIDFLFVHRARFLTSLGRCAVVLCAHLPEARVGRPLENVPLDE